MSAPKKISMKGVNGAKDLPAITDSLVNNSKMRPEEERDFIEALYDAQSLYSKILNLKDEDETNIHVQVIDALDQLIRFVDPIQE